MSSNQDYRQLLKDALVEMRKMRSQLERLEQEKNEPIAVIGMDCRFPGGADNPDAYWEILCDGVDGITEVPSSRWDIENYYDPNPDTPGKMYARYGGFIEDVDKFDPQFFGISPREAAAIDPQQRLLLEVSYNALENAGHSPAKLRGSKNGSTLSDSVLMTIPDAASTQEIRRALMLLIVWAILAVLPQEELLMYWGYRGQPYSLIRLVLLL